jgi:hypothetical protein
VQATSSAAKDPMTSYAINAMQKELESQQKEHPNVRATSSATPPAPSSAPQPHIMTAAEEAIEEATRKAKQHSGGLKIFSGNGNMALALEIARHLGINLGKATVGRFADGEVNVQIHENVRGKDCYVIQPTCPPVNDNLMELLLIVSTLSRASARRITVVIPYYGYARQDRKMQVRSDSEDYLAKMMSLYSSRKSRLVFPFQQRMWLVSWKPWALIVSLPSIFTVVRSRVSLAPAYPSITWTAASLE